MTRTVLHSRMSVPFGEVCHGGYERVENQDRVLHGDTPHGALFALSDGVGGNEDGGLAAAIVVEELLHSMRLQAGNSSAKSSLLQAVAQANAVVYKRSDVPADSSRRRMSATLVAALVDTARAEPLAIVANVGDSRAYLFRDNLLNQLSTDHTAARNMVHAGILSAEEAEHHPQNSVLTRSMGQAPEVQPSAVRVPLQTGDQLLLCSDGLHGYVPAAAIAAELARVDVAAQQKAGALLQLALQTGGCDNISVQVIGPLLVPVPGTAPDHLSASKSAFRARQIVAPSSSHASLPTRPGQSRMRLLLIMSILLMVFAALCIGAYLLWQARPVQAATPLEQRRCLLVLHQTDDPPTEQHGGSDAIAPHKA